MDVNGCPSPSPSMATSLSSMSVNELYNWLKTDGGIPDKFCDAFTGRFNRNARL